MKYLKISKCSLCDGLGVRVVLWVSGCTHYCKGCQNPCSWSYDEGKSFDREIFNALIECIDKPYVKGLTLSGGDPLAKENIETTTVVAKRIKEIFPQKDIWCYTGYLWEEVKHLQIMNYIDVLVDGEFELDKRDISLAFKGSGNQRIIDVHTGKTIEL